MKRAPLVISAALCLLWTLPGLAQAPVPEARDAYARGDRAFAAKNYALAAREFARADTLVPSDAALEAALEASILAGDPVLAMQLVDRVKDRKLDERSKKAAARANNLFATRVGRLTLPCDGTKVCRALVDGVEVDNVNAPVVVAPGHHTVRLLRDERTTEHGLDVAAEALVPVPMPREDAATAAPLPPPPNTPDFETPTPPNKSEKTGGPGVALTITSAGLTAVLGGLSVVSFLDLHAKRTDFENGGCNAGSRLPTVARDCNARANDGKNAQLRTDILIAGAGVFAAATVALIVFKPWRGQSTANGSSTGLTSGIKIAAGPSALVVAGDFQ